MSDSTGKLARDAAVSSLVSNAVYLAVMVGLAVAITRKDWIARQAARARAAVRRDWRKWSAAREISEFRAEVSRYEHDGGQAGDCGC
jgi:hypothetical protein